jgi:glycerophosphoryl diester phosphodiesterase
MAIGMGLAQGVKINARGALQFGATRTLDVLRLTAHMILRVIAGLLPFVIAAALVYAWLLRDHDINFYLSNRPDQFRLAAGILLVLAVGLLLLLARMIARWTLALPLVLFENVSPRRALRESAGRAVGFRLLILAALAAWAAAAIVLIVITAWLMNLAGRWIAPQLAGSLPLLLSFVGVFMLVSFILAVAVGVINVSMFSLLVAHLHLHVSAGRPPARNLARYASISIYRPSGIAVAALASIAVLATAGIVLFAFLINRDPQAALVIAHRGASDAAPENTLAAFRLAAEQKTDFIELDVQESADGEVLVVHDSDLMKVGGFPTRIWDGDAAALRSIDIGSFKDRRFSAERVPTLAEALAVCKGRCGVIVELKSYGHNQHLEERVAAIVEAAGMEKDCQFMSLDLDMVHRMKALRPSWRVGLLVAKAIGDLTELNADFLAVEARMATRRLIRQAHAAGQDVYIWTVDDPAWIFVALSRGVDGLITDQPDTARRVIDLRARMSESQRFLGALLIRMGASTKALATQDALRP